MARVAVDKYFVSNPVRAMGLPMKHIYKDCQHIKKAVVREMPATFRPLAGLHLCKACHKRYLKESAQQKGA